MPKFDPYDPDQFKRLRRSVKRNYQALKPFRTVRKLCVDAVKGHYYDADRDDPTFDRNPVNLLDQFQQVLVRSFVQTEPRVRITSRTDFKTAAIFQEHMNQTIQEIKLADTIRTCVQEAILGFMGIAFVGIAGNENNPAGESFVDSIPLPDFVLDMSHDKIDQADFMGHRMSKRIDDMKSNPIYDQEIVEKLSGRRNDTELRDRQGGRSEQEREDESLFDWKEFWSIHIPASGINVLYANDISFERPLRAEFHDGPEFGPYIFLRFDPVLDGIMSNSRAAMMLDMHEFVNGQYRRVFIKEDQAAEFFGYEGGSEDDARNYRDAMDGEVLQFNNVSGVQRFTKGGTNPQALAVAIHGRSLFDELSGNLRLLGGVGPIADTATQERLANQNASRLVRDMQLQVVAFVKQIIQNLAWYEWTHPTRQRQVEIKIGKNGRALEELWTPEIRDGDFIQYEIEIVPDSMEYRTSSQQLAELMKGVQGVVIPAMQMPSERPVVLKTPELIAKYAELAQVPELNEIVDYAADKAFVSPPAAQGSALRIPAGATSEGRLNGGARNGAGGGGGGDDQIVERVLSGSVSNSGGDDGGQG